VTEERQRGAECAAEGGERREEREGEREREKRD